MTTAYTSLLGLALPVTGELQGTWGDVVNDSITSLLDTAIAGTTSLTTDADTTLSDTDGASNQSRQAIVLWNPASGTVTRNITAPARSKTYVVINATGGTQSIVFRGVGPTTGVTILAGEKAVVAWNGSDFVKVSTFGGSPSFTNVTVTGTTTLSGLTASTALALNASKEVVSVTNTGSGNNVLATSPTLVTPVLGAATATSINGLTVSSTTGTLTLANGSTLATSGANSLTLTTTGATNVTFPTSGTLATTAGTVASFSAGTTGFTPSTATTGAVTLAGTLATTNGGTGLTSFTANGVVYASSTSALTSGSALTFDGTNLGVGGAVNAIAGYTSINISGGASGSFTDYKVNGTLEARILALPTDFRIQNITNGSVSFYTNSAEQMRLTSTGLGIGTSSPAYKLDVAGDIRVGVNTAYQLLLGQSSATKGSNIASSGGTSGNYNGLFLNSNGYGSGDNGAQFNTAQSSWRVAVGSGALEWAGSDAFAVGRVAAGGTFTSPSVLMKIDSSGNLGIGTSSPASKLVVSNGSNKNLEVQPGATTYLFAYDRTASDYLNLDIGGQILTFSTDTGAERMRLDASGNLGIGTSSPRSLLDLNSTRSVKAYWGTAGTLGETQNTAGDYVANNLFVSAESAGGGMTYTKTTADSGNAILQDFSRGITFYTGVTGAATTTGTLNTFERMRLDSSGNLGLGVTPSAWGSIFRVQQFGNYGAFIAGRSDAQNQIQMGVNAFFDGTNFVYSNTDVASRYYQISGQHRWDVAPSGTAGNAISFTQAMTLVGTLTPALLVGTTSDFGGFNFQAKNQVGFSVHNSADSSTAAYFSAAGNVTLTSAGSSAVVNGVDGILLGVNGTERARITSAGSFVAGAQAALATTATDGFLYVPTCAGQPTGTPTAITGMAPIVVDTTNNKLYFYSTGAWRDAGP